MPLSVDTRKVAKAWVVRWEKEEGVYGVAYEMSDGWHASDKIGTKAQAEAIVRDISNQSAALRAASKDACPQCRSNETYGWGVRHREQQEFPNRGCAACGCLWNEAGILKNGSR